MKTAAILHAENYGIKGTTDTNLFIEVIQKMIIPDFQPKKGVKIQVNENENTANAEAPGIFLSSIFFLPSFFFHLLLLLFELNQIEFFFLI